VRSEPGRYAALLLLLTMLAGLCVGADAPVRAQDAEGEIADAAAAPERPGVPQEPPSPVVVRDPLYRVEFELPAPFWQQMDNQALAAQAEQAPAGCTPQQVPADLLFVFTHKDAPVLGRLELGERSFLLRDKTGLEQYVDARVAAIGSQVGGAMQDSESSYAFSEGLITHRFDFTVPPQTGGGCAMGAGAGGGPAMRYAIVQHFVRPQGADALLFVMFCYAPADAFLQLRPEIDAIVHSFRYTGELDAEFFAPDAPEAKLLTAADAAKGTQKGFNWLMPVGLAVFIWLMIRRKKQKPA